MKKINMFEPHDAAEIADAVRFLRRRLKLPVDIRCRGRECFVKLRGVQGGELRFTYYGGRVFAYEDGQYISSIFTMPAILAEIINLVLGKDVAVFVKEYAPPRCTLAIYWSTHYFEVPFLEDGVLVLRRSDIENVLRQIAYISL